MFLDASRLARPSRGLRTVKSHFSVEIIDLNRDVGCQLIIMLQACLKKKRKHRIHKNDSTLYPDRIRRRLFTSSTSGRDVGCQLIIVLQACLKKKRRYRIHKNNSTLYPDRIRRPALYIFHLGPRRRMSTYHKSKPPNKPHDFDPWSRGTFVCLLFF